LIGGNPLDDKEEMVRQAVIQKLITLINVASIFSLSFAFSSQLKNLKLN
jgi:hypothetical protein